jgi:hypothetical protein
MRRHTRVQNPLGKEKALEGTEIKALKTNLGKI